MSNDKHLRCSFCGKSKDSVRKFISGPSVYICNECITLCNEILAEDEQREATETQRPVPSPHPPPQEDRDRRAQTGVQRRDRRDQIDAGLPLVYQPSGRVEVEPGPAARRDSLDPLVGARLRGAGESRRVR